MPEEPPPSSAWQAIDEALLAGRLDEAEALLQRRDGEVEPAARALRDTALQRAREQFAPPAGERLELLLATALVAVADPAPDLQRLWPDPLRPERCFAQSHGPLRSDDAGRSWRYLRDELPQLPYQSTLMRAPDQPDRLLVTPGKDLAGWQSLDGGDSWHGIPPPQPTGRCQLFLGGQDLLVCLVQDTAKGPWRCHRSRDAGRTWQAGSECVELQAAIPHHAGLLLLASLRRNHRDTEYLVSTDGGEHFRTVPWQASRVPRSRRPVEATLDRLVGITATDIFLPQAAGTVLAIDGAGDLRTSFECRTAALFDGQHELLVHPRHPQRWYLLHRDRGLWRSDDGGRHFRRGRAGLAALRGRGLACDADGRVVLVESLRDRSRLLRFADGDDPTVFFAEVADER